MVDMIIINKLLINNYNELNNLTFDIFCLLIFSQKKIVLANSVLLPF